jgi:3-oxoacyl-[acyl-carrier protein] reductase
MDTAVCSLEGRKAVITGGSRGIGRAISLTFAHAGADVAICNELMDDDLKITADEIRKLGRRSLALKADISHQDEVDTFVQKAAQEFGSIDIFVNNAAVALVRAPLHEIKESEWDQEVDTNLKGYHFCCQAAAAVMKKQKKGSIINMASVSGMRSAIKRGAYGISKSGVIMLTMILAAELGPSNIRVNAIAPGVVMTERTRPIWGNDEKRKQVEDSIPLQRFAVPQDIANAALFLASDISSYITGHTLVVDGGVMAQPPSYDMIVFR